jgi:AMMECR1 domain-containing protein
MSRPLPIPSENRSENLDGETGSGPLSGEFSREQRHILLGIAHGAIVAFLEQRALADAEGLPASLPPILREPRGVFSTLYLNGQLRGCVGYAAAVAPLYRAVAETARAAAFEDSRFPPVTLEEVRAGAGAGAGAKPKPEAKPEPKPEAKPTAGSKAADRSVRSTRACLLRSGLEVSLSVLSPLFPIRPDAVEVGRQGLVVSLGGRRGLLLPQVPVEHGWDRETFLEQTCRKAGLPLDAWRRGATIEAFTAEVFGDGDV